jgi:polysaccharide transporter, PST family
VRVAQLPMMPFRLTAYPRVLARLNESRQAGKELVLRLAAVLLPAMAIGSLVLFLGSDFIVRLILGPQMMPAAHLLRLMALLPLLSAASDILSIFWLLPNGRDRVVTAIVVTGLVAQIGTIALLAVSRPATAGAIAVTAAQLIAFLLCTWFVWREVREKTGK